MTDSPSHFGFWIADFGLSERDFEGNAFIGLFSWVSIKNLILNHLITRSARASTFCRIVRPICLAALRLIASSNFFDCSTGKSTVFFFWGGLSTKNDANPHVRQMD